MRSLIDLQNLKNLMVDHENIEIVTHPNNIKYLREIEDQVKKERGSYLHFISPISHLTGIKIITSEVLSPWVQVWELPNVPFVEWEEGDKDWAYPIGYGKWKNTDIPAFYKINKNYLKMWQTPITFCDSRKFIITA